MARGPGLRWAISFALVRHVVSFQLAVSPIVGRFGCGGGGPWRGVTRSYLSNHVREQDDSGTTAGTDIHDGLGQAEAKKEEAAAMAGKESSPLADYFLR